ncbi:MAG: hypothetical protein KAV18_07290, partial [Candidatus Omnitrophica bacterium]|nr:hypothetical protein [Candidatus Omnitrophota bacterium]
MKNSIRRCFLSLIILFISLQLNCIIPVWADIWISSPADKENIFGKIKIIAEADDKERIDEVKFFINSQRSGYCLDFPFEKIIDIGLHGPGAHSIRVKAIFKSGLSLWSEPVRIIVEEDK